MEEAQLDLFKDTPKAPTIEEDLEVCAKKVRDGLVRRAFAGRGGYRVERHLSRGDLGAFLEAAFRLGWDLALERHGNAGAREALRQFSDLVAMENGKEDRAAIVWVLNGLHGGPSRPQTVYQAQLFNLGVDIREALGRSARYHLVNGELVKCP